MKVFDLLGTSENVTELSKSLIMLWTGVLRDSCPNTAFNTALMSSMYLHGLLVFGGHLLPGALLSRDQPVVEPAQNVEHGVVVSLIPTAS